MALLEQSYNGVHFIAASFALSCIAFDLLQEVLGAGKQWVNVKHHGIVTLHSLALHYVAFVRGGTAGHWGVKTIHDVLCSTMCIAFILSLEDEIHCNQDECNGSQGSKTFMMFRAAQSLLTQCNGRTAHTLNRWMTNRQNNKQIWASNRQDNKQIQETCTNPLNATQNMEV